MTVCLSGPPPEAAGARIDVQLLSRRARAVLRVLQRRDAELSVALVDDAEIASLNQAYRDKSGPTDVLSFSLLEGAHADHARNLLGDVVIGIEVAARQARERRRGLDEEVARLLIHGVLHLIGHDHEEDDEARVMKAEERRVWAALPE